METLFASIRIQARSLMGMDVHTNFYGVLQTLGVALHRIPLSTYYEPYTPSSIAEPWDEPPGLFNLWNLLNREEEFLVVIGRARIPSLTCAPNSSKKEKTGDR